MILPPKNCKGRYSFNDLVFEDCRLVECEFSKRNDLTRKLKDAPGKTIAFFMQHDDANAGYDSISTKNCKSTREIKDPLPEILSRLLTQAIDNKFRLIADVSAHFTNQSNGYSTEGYLVVAKGYR